MERKIDGPQMNANECEWGQVSEVTSAGLRKGHVDLLAIAVGDRPKRASELGGVVASVPFGVPALAAFFKLWTRQGAGDRLCVWTGKSLNEPFIPSYS